MKLFKSLNKPEYIFRPKQILVRLWRELANTKQFEEVMLPWGVNIRIRPDEMIGSCIWRLGIYDLCVSECIWRLLDPDELALDVGANIGCMTIVMALKVGRQGKIITLEPHPEIFKELQHNVEQWKESDQIGKIVLMNQAMSDYCGYGLLQMPKFFEANRGLASLEDHEGEAAGDLKKHTVRVTTLDYLVQEATKIGLLKIDVEGHELSTLKGAKHMLERRAVRDIIFEEHNIPPTPVTDWLQTWGYSVFYVGQRLSGLDMVSITDRYQRQRCDAPSCLATIDPERAYHRLQKHGWQVFGRWFQ